MPGTSSSTIFFMEPMLRGLQQLSPDLRSEMATSYRLHGLISAHIPKTSNHWNVSVVMCIMYHLNPTATHTHTPVSYHRLRVEMKTVTG